MSSVVESFKLLPMAKVPRAQAVTADKTPECVPGSHRALVSGEYEFPWADTWLAPSIALPVGLVTGTSTFSRAMVAVSHEPTK